MKTRYLESKGRSIFLFLALMAPYIFLCMTRTCFSSAMVFIVNEEVMTSFQTGTITAVFYIVYASLQIAAGILTDKWKPEKLIAISLIGGSVLNILIYFFITNYIAILLIWSFNAILQAPAWPAAFKIFSTMLSPNITQKALVFASLGYSLGSILCSGVSAILPNWKLLFIVSSVGLFVFAVWWITSFRYAVKPHLTEKEIVKIDYAGMAKVEHKGILYLTITSGLVFILIFNFIRSTLDYGVKALTPTMINGCYEGVSPSLATTLNIFILVAGIFGPFLAQTVYPRLFKNEVAACAVFLTAALPFIIMIGFVGQINYWFIVIALAFLALCMSSAGLFTTSLIAAKFNKWGKGATVAGMTNTVASISIVTANMLFTAISESAGWSVTTSIWIIMLFIGVALAIITIPIWKKFSVKSRNL